MPVIVSISLFQYLTRSDESSVIIPAGALSMIFSLNSLRYARFLFASASSCLENLSVSAICFIELEISPLSCSVIVNLSSKIMVAMAEPRAPDNTLSASSLNLIRSSCDMESLFIPCFAMKLFTTSLASLPPIYCPSIPCICCML